MERKPRPRPEKSGSFICREEKKHPEPARKLSTGSIKARFDVIDERESPKLDFSLISLEINKFLEALETETTPPEIPQPAFSQLLELVEREIIGARSIADSRAIDQSSRLFFALSKFPENEKYSMSANLTRAALRRAKTLLQERESPKLGTQNEPDFSLISLEVNKFLEALERETPPPEIPQSAFSQLLEVVEREITGARSIAESRAIESIDQSSRLFSAFSKFSENEKYSTSANLTGATLQRAMTFLEEEFRLLLEEPAAAAAAASSPLAPDSEKSPRTPLSPAYCGPTLDLLQRIAAAMINAGYAAECCHVYTLSRRHVILHTIARLGYDKISIEDVQKMTWESLEGEISSWIKAFKQIYTVHFFRERDLSRSIFSEHLHVAGSLFRNLFRGVILQFLSFSEAVAMTKRSTEKLFKLLDMYEALKDLEEQIVEEEEEDLRSEIELSRSRLGESAVGIFSDLENSIKSDAAKTPVPGGAVHPLTRYVMNYLKYACEYKKTLEELFLQCKRTESPNANPNPNAETPFATQLIGVMGLLDSNLETKSKLYKDPSLSHVFLMNNGRYILQKIKGSAEIHDLLGDNWCRKKSSELRQYHKNYQRETWGRVLGCFRDEGLQVRGVVSKPVLKERFRSFNAMFEEIHKTQSCWVVCDEQLQSELRVSVCSVVVPAYRSFLGRFQQYLDSGRQSEKYIKFGPEDLETFIDDLFDGNPASTVKRRS